MQGFGAIPIFVAVIEQGGFSAAARFLGITKSAVSKRVTQLEEELGEKLLHRTTRKLSLTEAGEHYFSYAVKANQAAKDAHDAVAQLQGEPRGRLRISSPMSFGRLHVAPFIPEFLKRYPKISIDLVMDDKVVDLVGGGFDIAIRTGKLANSALFARKLAPFNSVLCASPAYLKECGSPSTLEQLKDHNCLLFSYSDDIKYWTFIDAEKKHEIEITGNYQANNSEALHDAILQGLGIGRLPTFVAGPDIKSGKLVQLFPEYKMAQNTFYAVFLERQYMPAKVRVFLDFSIDYFGGTLPYWDLDD